MNIFSLWQIAFRNTLKNHRRAFFTAFTVGVGIVAFSLIQGYFTKIYETLEDKAVVGERLGHLVITKEGFYKVGGQDPAKYAFSRDEYRRIAAALSKDPEVELVSPRLGVSGLISNGDSSRIFFGEALKPSDMDVLRGTKYASLPGKLREDSPNGGVLGSKLAQYLNVKPGGSVVLLTPTVGGMVNARDLTVEEVANTGSSATDDKFVLLPLDFARKLVAFDGADRVSVKLKDGASLEGVRHRVAAQIASLGLKVQIKTWKELSQYYGQVKGLFDMMSAFLAIVIALVVMATVTNTIGMSISERTREVATMRAFGMQAYSIDIMFLLEGAIITAIGASVGAVATVVLASAVNMMGIKYTPPDASAQASLEMAIVPAHLVETFCLLVLVGASSAYFIARRATRTNIVEALSHV